MKKRLCASALAALAAWFAVSLVAISGAPVPPDLSRLQVTHNPQEFNHLPSHEQAGEDLQEISSRALRHFSLNLDSAAGQAGDNFDHSWAELQTPASHIEYTPLVNDERPTSGSKRSFDALTSHQLHPNPHASFTTQTDPPLYTTSESHVWLPANSEEAAFPLWHPEMEAEWRDFIWSDKEVNELSSLNVKERKVVWIRVRRRKRNNQRRPPFLSSAGSKSLASPAAGTTEELASRLTQLKHNAYKKIKRLEAAKPDPSDTRATARWQQKMEAELAFTDHAKSTLSEIRPPKSARPVDFVGLTEQELQLFGSKYSEDRTKLQSRINSRIWRAEKVDPSIPTARMVQAKLRADKAWLELLDLLKDMLPQIASVLTADIMAKIRAMPSEQAAEHVAGVVERLVERLRQSSSSAQANKTLRADSSSGGALETPSSSRQQTDRPNKSAQEEGVEIVIELSIDYVPKLTAVLS